MSQRRISLRRRRRRRGEKREWGEREKGSFDDTELGGENLSAAVVDDCPHVCTNHPYTADESCGIKEEAYISCTLISSMG